MRVATDAADAETLLAAVPASQRVAVVDARFVGHVHALRLGLTDPRFDAAAIPGAVTARPAARPALTRALRTASDDASNGSVVVGILAERIAEVLDTDLHRPELGELVAEVPRTRRPATRPGRPSPSWTTRRSGCVRP